MRLGGRRAGLPRSTARLGLLLLVVGLVGDGRVLVVLFVFSFDVRAAGRVCGAGQATGETWGRAHSAQRHEI